MRRTPISRVAARVAAILALVAFASVAPEAHAAASWPQSVAPKELLPDLDQETPSDLKVMNVGSRVAPVFVLGFGSAVRNIGDGPFTVSGHRTPDEPAMTADQLVQRADGSQDVVPGIGFLRYVSSPDHSHWHYLGFDRYELRRAATGTVLVRDRKSGFCLGDRYRATRQPLDAAAPEPVYRGRCHLFETGLLEITEGISVGWGDDYDRFLEFQDLTLTGLESGRYVLVHRVNANRKIRELSYSNNAASVLLDLHWRGGEPYLRVLASCPDSARCDTPRRSARASSAGPPIARAAGEPYLPNDTADGPPGSWADVQWNFTGPFGVNAPLAWSNLIADGAPGGAGVTVAVVDTGVAYADAPPFRISPDFDPAQFVPGWDFVDDDPYPFDENGHGTHVASTIAEETDNDYGLTGLAYGTRIMPVRVLDATGAGDADTIARGVRYAVDHGAKIINLSLNFDPRVTASQIPQLLAALDYAARHGSLVVAAAGNDRAGLIPYPGRSSNVLAVGGTTESGCLAGYSDVGPELDLVAPGGGNDAAVPGDPNCRPGRVGRSISQITFDGGIDRFGVPAGWFGTSMAAAHVSATAALIVASRANGANPTPAQIVARLEGTTRDLGAPGFDDDYGWGLVDAGAATETFPDAPPPPAATTAAVSIPATVTPNLIVRVHASVVLRARPGGPVIATAPTTTPFGSPETLSVVAHSGRWLEVTSELLPTGTTGWVDSRSAGVVLARTRLSILVRLRARTLELRAGTKVLRRFSVGIGAPGSPTPTGRFAVTDKLRGARYSPAYGCCILALTAYQNHLPPGWLGGDRIAVHGTNAPASVGGASSAGCLHARDADLEDLFGRVPLGTPVVIRQ